MDYEALYRQALANGLGSMTNQFGQMNSGGRGADDFGQTPWNSADVGNGMSYIVENGKKRLVMPSDNPGKGKLMAYDVDEQGRPVGEPFYYTNPGLLKSFGNDLRDLAPVILAAVGGAALGGAGGAAGAGAAEGAAMGVGAGSGNMLTPALMESMIGSAGYGASSAGLGGIGAGAIGGGGLLDFSALGLGSGAEGASFFTAPGAAGFGADAAGMVGTGAAGGGGGFWDTLGSKSADFFSSPKNILNTIGTIGTLYEMGKDPEPVNQSSTMTKVLDPALQSALYGDGGLLGKMQGYFSANPGGQNQTMKDAQSGMQGLLKNPDVINSLYKMGAAGSGLLNNGVGGSAEKPWWWRG